MRPGLFSARLGLALAAALAACSTGYQKFSITGGYIDKPIGKDTALVVAGGNGWTSRAKIEAILMLRSAELTLEHGYRRFSLVKPDEKTKQAEQAGQEVQLPPYLRARAARNNSGPLLAQETTTIFNPYVGALGVKKHSGAAYVVMSNAGGTYDAREVVARLRPKLVPKEGTESAKAKRRRGRDRATMQSARGCVCRIGSPAAGSGWPRSSVIAPFGGAEEMVKDQKAKVIAEREVTFVAVGEQGERG